MVPWPPVIAHPLPRPVASIDHTRVHTGARHVTFALRLFPVLPHGGNCGGALIEQDGPPITVTVKVQLLWLPQSSVAVQVTVVTPTGNTLPEGGTQTTVGVESHVSLTVGANVAVFAQAPRVILFGHVIDGGVVSTTVIV